MVRSAAIVEPPPLFDFAVPEELLKAAVAQRGVTDNIAELSMMAGTGEGKPPPMPANP